jgi:hypothetical protein
MTLTTNGWPTLFEAAGATSEMTEAKYAEMKIGLIPKTIGATALRGAPVIVEMRQTDEIVERNVAIKPHNVCIVDDPLACGQNVPAVITDQIDYKAMWARVLAEYPRVLAKFAKPDILAITRDIARGE